MKQTRLRLDAATRRKQFESATVALVSARGYKAVTTESVAQQANVSKGLLWRYYDNLEDLMEATARRALRDLEAAVAEQLDFELPVPQLLWQAIRRAAHLPESHRAELLALQRIAVNLQSPDGDPALSGTTGYRQLYEHQVTLLKRGQQAGEIRPDIDLHLFARIYQGAVDTMIEQLIADPKLDPEKYAAAVGDVLLQGIAADQS